MPTNIKIHKLANGLTILGEQMSDVSSTAFNLLIPCGAAYDSPTSLGSAKILASCFEKGGGGMDTKDIANTLARLGASTSDSVGYETSSFKGVSLDNNFVAMFEIIAKTIIAPSFPESAIENLKQLSLQELLANKEEPASRVYDELYKAYYPEPFGRNILGEVQTIESIDREVINSQYKTYYNPDGAILSIAGKFDWDSLLASAERILGEWTGEHHKIKAEDFHPQKKYVHLEEDSQQMQILMAYPSVAIDSPEYYNARVAINLLSGGMSGRLFIEVREKRGLVYSVSASHSGTIGRPTIFVYAGTTPKNAQETYEVILGELNSLQKNISQVELDRAKVDLKTRVIMAQESTISRCQTLASDFWSLGRVRTITEIKENINNVTEKSIINYLEQHPPKEVTLVTLGSAKVSV